MQTPNERIGELEEQVKRLERQKTVALTVGFTAVEAALTSLRDNRVIQNVHLKLALEAVEQEIKEGLASEPELLDVFRNGYFRPIFRR